MNTGYSHIIKNLINTGDGYYISLNDPGIYEKIKHSHAGNGKFLYNAALALEKQADLCLREFRETRSRRSYRNYRKRLQESLEIMRKSWEKGCICAGKDILRIDRRLGSKSHYAPHLLTIIIDFSTLLLLCLITGLLIPVVVYLLIR
ncbi:MAG: hypothetical protein M1130_00290 [Actinobacteria bacterium]|nr:hypothetical protein [Actinomycetota bacterium]